MSKDLIVKSNTVVSASYQLTANEQRLILSAISQIPKGKEVRDDEVYTVGVEDFIQLGVHPKTAYREMREAAERLYERSVSLKVDDSFIKVRWIQEMGVGTSYQLISMAKSLGLNPIKISDEHQFLYIRFSKSLIPFLSNLSANFTQYLKQDIAGLSSAYSIRFYELIAQFKETGYRKIHIDDLRLMLDLGDKYQATKDLKVRVIETAVNELNEKSPIQVAYKLLKTGKKYTHLELKFKPKKGKENKIDRDLNTIDWINGVTDNEIKKKPSWQTKGLSDAQIKKLAIYTKEFVDANSSKILPNDRRDYPEIFEGWKNQLKDPTKVNLFNKIQELLERQRT